ncbi:AAA-ATPase ASD, mitochondrial-like [Zingiber officinale]|uniref:AAA+ ATPase domain-containing protein n=1 Tax=Zingiber officinale TaxID=94328 RepID=A0A8J5EDY3_ZINOF|nr:AAA-ATPase ASD, mitochondrial-like [Zingiber officinale]KAG6473464.1 hypothetical protein ZIOFF_067380 [Zingiber officinale]
MERLESFGKLAEWGSSALSIIFSASTYVWRRIYPYIEITFTEYAGEHLKRSEAYAAIDAYLGDLCRDTAVRIKAMTSNEGGDNVVFSMDDNEEIAVDLDGVKVWWLASKSVPRVTSIYFGRGPPEDPRYYRLAFHHRHRDFVVGQYINFVLSKGKQIAADQRKKKLYTNKSTIGWNPYEQRETLWSHVPFEHRAKFETLAMEESKKRDILEDLDRFRSNRDYYRKLGKPWKRGYLLYGPPGTGKSTMIAAMANHLGYDIYDLELTAVKDNTDMRKLLIETKDKCIIVIEDVDYMLDLWNRRKKVIEAQIEAEKAALVPKASDEESKVTLPGLLNFIDGLWTSCGGERIIVLTTNHYESLDPALKRRGRMDIHVEMSYCSYEAFKILAKNYLNIDGHQLFRKIKRLLAENEVTPAEVAEALMHKSGDDVDTQEVRKCLENLIGILKSKDSKSSSSKISKRRRVIDKSVGVLY